MKVYEILAGKLYQRGRFDKWPKERKLLELKELGITVVANMIRIPDDDISGPDGVEYYMLPIADGKIKDPDMLNKLADRLFQRIMEGKKVLIHCNAGRNRSGLVSALVVRRYYYLSGHEALNYVRRVRPQAIANPHFEAYLEGLP